MLLLSDLDVTIMCLFVGSPFSDPPLGDGVCLLHAYTVTLYTMVMTQSNDTIITLTL